jgi:hypothetical protein
MAAVREVPYNVSISQLSVKILFHVLHSKEIIGNFFLNHCVTNMAGIMLY